MKKIQKISIFSCFIFIFYLLTTINYAIAVDQTTTYDKEQLKRDYKIFLEQLKSLNAQYKEVTIPIR